MDLSIGKSRWLRVSTLLAAAAMLASACGTTPSGTSETPKNGGTLTWALDADAQSLNPFVAGDVPSFRALSPMMVKLSQTHNDLNVVPRLAHRMPQVPPE